MMLVLSLNWHQVCLFVFVPESSDRCLLLGQRLHFQDMSECALLSLSCTCGACVSLILPFPQLCTRRVPRGLLLPPGLAVPLRVLQRHVLPARHRDRPHLPAGLGVAQRHRRPLHAAELLLPVPTGPLRQRRVPAVLRRVPRRVRLPLRRHGPGAHQRHPAARLHLPEGLLLSWLGRNVNHKSQHDCSSCVVWIFGEVFIPCL